MNSVSVSVLITTTANSMSLIDMSVLVNNVTNPSSPNGNVAEASCLLNRNAFAWCMPILFVESVGLLVRPQISLTNVVVLRNITNVLALQSTNLHLGHLYFENITFSGSKPCFYFEGLTQSVSSVMGANIAMSNMTVIASGSFPLKNTEYSLVLDFREATIYSSNIVLDRLYVTDDPLRGARASGLGTLNLILFSASLSNSTVVISNAIIDVVALSSGVFVLLYRSSSFRDGSFLRFLHSSVVAANDSVTHIDLVQCQTSVQGSFLELHNTQIDAPSSGNSTTATITFLYITSFSEVVKSSQLTLVDSHLRTLRGGQLVYSEALALSDTLVMITDSSASASLDLVTEALSTFQHHYNRQFSIL